MMRSALPSPSMRERLGEEIEDHALGLVGADVGEFAQDRDRFALARLERLVGLERRKIAEVDDRQGRFEMAELAQFLGSHGDLVRAAAAEDRDGPDRRRVERVERVADDVRSFELAARLRQDPRAIERDIAVADDRRVRAGERRIEVGEIGMAVVPADELGRADDAGQILAGNAELAVVRRADGEDDRVVELEQLVDRHVAADGDIADEVDARAFGDLVVALADRLQRLVVGRDAEADQAVGHRIAVEDVDRAPDRHRPFPAPRRCRSPPAPNRPPRNAACSPPSCVSRACSADCGARACKRHLR